MKKFHATPSFLLQNFFLLTLISLGAVVAVSVIALTFSSVTPTDSSPSSISESEKITANHTAIEPTNESPTEQVESLLELPTKKFLTEGTHAFQTFNNCGPASLSMALSHHGISVGQQELGRALRPYQNPQGDNDDKSVTLTELAAKAEEYGFIVYHRPAGDVKLLQDFISQDMPVIARTWLEPGEDIGHYRVVTGYDLTAQVLVQNDSLQGRDVRYSYDDFLEIWRAFNYEFLVLVPSEKQQVAERILGNRLDQNQAWEVALAITKQQLEQEQNQVEAQFNQVVALYHLGEYQAAIEVYEQIEDRLPSRTLWYQLEPLLAYYKLGQFKQVLQKTEVVFDSQNRAYSELHYLRGMIFEEQGLPEQAQQSFALAQQYNSAQFWRQNIE